MKKKLIKIGVITFSVIAVLHTTVCFITSHFIEDSLNNLPILLKQTDDPILKKANLSYKSKSSGIYNREGTLVVEHPLIKNSEIPIKIHSGFLHANIHAKFDDLLNHLVGHNDFIPAFTGKSSVAYVNINASVWSLGASGDLLVHAPYRGKK